MSRSAGAGAEFAGFAGENDIALSGPLTAGVDRRYAAPNTVSMDPALYGEWTTLAYPTTVRAIHVTLLRTGKVLLMAGSGNLAANLAAGSFTAEVWDPVTHTLVQVSCPTRFDWVPSLSEARDAARRRR